MRITIESTPKIVELVLGNNTRVPARIWQGESEDGIPVQVFVTRIAPEIPENHVRIAELTAEFEKDLQRCAEPRPTIEAIPLRLII